MLTMICNVSTLGKHLRNVGSALVSLCIPNRTLNPRIFTLVTVVVGLAFVPNYNPCAIPHQSITMKIYVHMEL
jgi:hypothetical protein